MASERPRSKGRGSYERGWTGLARQVKGQERATVNALLCPLFLFLPTINLPTLLCTPMCLQNHKIPRRNFLCTLHLARRGLRVHKGIGQVGCSGVQVGRAGRRVCGAFEGGSSAQPLSVCPFLLPVPGTMGVVRFPLLCNLVPNK